MRETEADVETDDADLVAAARVDPETFAALYERYVGPIYRFCYVRLGGREAAEDATSEVFLRAFAGLGDYRGGAFAAWIYRIARNVIADRHRRWLPKDTIDAAEDVAAALSTPEESAVEQAEREELRRAVAMLPNDQRAAIELRLAGWPDKQIGEALGKTVAAVKKLRFRAVRRLRKFLIPAREGLKEGHDVDA